MKPRAIVANLSLLFAEAPLVERFERARRAGFDGVEIQFPYDVPAEDLARAEHDSRLPIVLVNLPAADLLAGGDGLGCVPGKEADFDRGVSLCLEYARTLDVPRVNLLSGRVPEGERASTCATVLRRNLEAATSALRPHGIEVVLEAINTFDMPRFFLDETEKVIALLDESGIDAKVQYDVYHMAKMGEDVCAVLRRHARRIAHVQVADVPSRSAPYTGELDFDRVFATLVDVGYEGAVAAEYKPGGPTEPTLAFLARMRAALA